MKPLDAKTLFKGEFLSNSLTIDKLEIVQLPRAPHLSFRLEATYKNQAPNNKFEVNKLIKNTLNELINKRYYSKLTHHSNSGILANNTTFYTGFTRRNEVKIAVLQSRRPTLRMSFLLSRDNMQLYNGIDFSQIVKAVTSDLDGQYSK